MKQYNDICSHYELNDGSMCKMIDNTCAICLSVMSENLTLLLCGHLYHSMCIRLCLKVFNMCPICKMLVLDLTSKGSTDDKKDDNDSNGGGKPTRRTSDRSKNKTKSLPYTFVPRRSARV